MNISFKSVESIVVTCRNNVHDGVPPPMETPNVRRLIRAEPGVRTYQYMFASSVQAARGAKEVSQMVMSEDPRLVEIKMRFRRFIGCPSATLGEPRKMFFEGLRKTPEINELISNPHFRWLEWLMVRQFYTEADFGRRAVDLERIFRRWKKSELSAVLQLPDAYVRHFVRKVAEWRLRSHFNYDTDAHICTEGYCRCLRCGRCYYFGCECRNATSPDPDDGADMDREYGMDDAQLECYSRGGSD